MLVEPQPGVVSSATTGGGTRVCCPRPTPQATLHPRTGEATNPVQQDSPTHRVTLIVEVDEPTDLSPADLVAMADMLREAATELAPHGTTRASVELGVLGESAPPAPRTPAHDGVTGQPA